MDTFLTHKKIYYHDTDCGGVVYYANYMKYLEEARTEYLLSKNIDTRKNDALFAVRKTEIRYRAPARYGDTIDVFTELIPSLSKQDLR